MMVATYSPFGKHRSSHNWMKPRGWVVFLTQIWHWLGSQWLGMVGDRGQEPCCERGNAEKTFLSVFSASGWNEKSNPCENTSFEFIILGICHRKDAPSLRRRRRRHRATSTRKKYPDFMHLIHISKVEYALNCLDTDSSTPPVRIIKMSNQHLRYRQRDE